MFRGDARAGVADGDLDEIAGFQLLDLSFRNGDILDFDAKVATAVHRVAGVDREIEDGIFELGPVGPDVPGFIRKAGVHRDPFADRAIDQLKHVLDQFGGSDGLRQERLGASERQKPPGQSCGPGGTLHGAVEMELHFALGAVKLAPG